MILIHTYNKVSLLPYLADEGIDPTKVQWGGQPSSETKVIVYVGGPGVYATHCYIQQHQSTPIISCLDPARVYLDPHAEFFIRQALAKAKNLAEESAEILNIDNNLFIPKTLDDVVKFFKRIILSSELVSVDIECNKENQELTCIGFAINGEAMSVPLQHEDRRYWSLEEEAVLWKMIARFLSHTNPKLFQNFSFDSTILSYWGILIGGAIYDTMTLAHLIQPELPKGLSDLARIYLYCDTWKDIKSWVSNESLWRYNARDALYTLKIHDEQLSTLAADKTRYDFYLNHLVPLHTAVYSMMVEGLRIDTDKLTALSKSYEAEVSNLRQDLEIFAREYILPKTKLIERKGRVKRDGTVYINEVGEVIEIPADIKMLKKLPFKVFEQKVSTQVFNPSSPPLVKEVIRALGHKVPSKKDVAKGTKETTDEFALKKLRLKTKHPFYSQLLEYREKSKILTTYCAIKLDNDNRLRSHITVPGTVSSRFSSRQTAWGTGCNVQNIPSHFRSIILPDRTDHKIVNMDFKAADPHVVAWLAGEQKMLDIMDSGQDIHAYTASAIAGRDITKASDYDAKTNHFRKLGKACNNGLNYLMGLKRFIDTCFDSMGLILTEAEAKHAIDTYFRLYPNIKQWQKDIEAEITKTRTLRTPLGRARHFWGSMNYKVIQEACAYIPPNLVSDVLNKGWLRFAKEKGSMRARMMIQCHDSLTFSCHKDDVWRLEKLLREIYRTETFMINGAERHFDIDISVSDHWS